jgi:hypothetical protein
VIVVAAALFAALVAVQGRPNATSAPEKQPPRTLSGRVVRPGKTGMIAVPNSWVTLHRVAADSSGPVDSVRTDAAGNYSIHYTPFGTDAAYFASSTFGGVAYFTTPLPATDAGGLAGEITVFDTTSSPVHIRTRGRHIVVSVSGVNGQRTIVEVFDLSNDTTVTAIAGARGHATWNTPLPPNAANFEVGQSDIGGAAVQFRDGRVLVFASISPGQRQVAFSYSLPASDFPLAVPVRDSVDVFEVLLEDPGATVTGGGLTERPSVPLEGRTFRRFMGEDVAAGSTLTIDTGAPTGPAKNRWVFLPAVVTAAVMGIALLFALTRRQRVHAVTRLEAEPDAARLARDIAELDDAFERVASPSDADREAYRERRDALKAQLSRALAKDSVAV